MSVRLQVLLSEAEMDDIKGLARRENLSVGEWVRRTLKESRLKRPGREPEEKLRAVREAAKYSFPTSDIDQMNREIEQGYLE